MQPITRLGLLCFLLVGGCRDSMSPRPFDPGFEVAPGTRQLVFVRRSDSVPTHVGVQAWERNHDTWQQAFPPMTGVIGRNGFAAAGAKREGDGKTPSGIYPIRRAFGYADSIKTGLEYRRAGNDDFWVDDPESPQYNQWIHGTPKAASFERMKRDDDFYKLGAVIEYNTDPVVPGRGSAIFLHLWSGPDSTTAGCVALSENDVSTLLQWLDRSKNPIIALGAP